MPIQAAVAKSRTVGVRLTAREAVAVQATATANDVTVSEWIRGLIREALKHVKNVKKVRK